MLVDKINSVYWGSNKDDLKILKESLLQLNKNRYLSQLNIVKPFEKYIELSKKAPEYLISKIC